MFKLKRPLRGSEKILIFLLILAMIGVILKWEDVKEGMVKGWEAYSIEKWFSRD